MKRYLLLLIVLSFILAGCFTVLPGQTQTDPADPKNTTGGSTETDPPVGWITEAAQTFYVNEDGSRHKGWLELDGTRYYLDNQGILQTGWLELDGSTYFLKSDGSITRGKATISSRTYYFTASGEKIIVANPWNIIPADYTPNLQVAEGNQKVDELCRDGLLEMLADCRKAGHGVQIISAYRENSTQIMLYNNKVNYYLDRGYNKVDAAKEAATVVAMPGTSEHELGLAVDLVDTDYPYLDEAQENTDTQKWLMENCWKYGFILRYPNNKSSKTGIIYEPWHYRYVGAALAEELHTTGLCLEEYLENLH